MSNAHIAQRAAAYTGGRVPVAKAALGQIQLHAGLDAAQAAVTLNRDSILATIDPDTVFTTTTAPTTPAASTPAPITHASGYVLPDFCLVQYPQLSSRRDESA